MIEALPDQIIIKDQLWQCISTADTDEGVIDTLKNTISGEIRSVERMKLINYLQKNKPKILHSNKINVNLYSSNNQQILKL